MQGLIFKAFSLFISLVMKFPSIQFLYPLDSIQGHGAGVYTSYHWTISMSTLDGFPVHRLANTESPSFNQH